MKRWRTQYSLVVLVRVRAKKLKKEGGNGAYVYRCMTRDLSTVDHSILTVINSNNLTQQYPGIITPDPDEKLAQKRHEYRYGVRTSRTFL